MTAPQGVEKVDTARQIDLQTVEKILAQLAFTWADVHVGQGSRWRKIGGGMV